MMLNINTRDLFIKKIDEYNKNKEYHTHYIKINDGKNVMVIDWINKWSYRVYELEEK